jgi:hypothetical protein
MNELKTKFNWKNIITVFLIWFVSLNILIGIDVFFF